MQALTYQRFAFSGDYLLVKDQSLWVLYHLSYHMGLISSIILHGTYHETVACVLTTRRNSV